MVHKPKHKVHTFKGMILTGGQDEINLEGQNVNVAYRILSFKIMGRDPLVDEGETVMKVYRESQSSINGQVDFTDPDLLAAALYTNRATARTYPINQVMLSDTTIFSRNVYVTMLDDSASTGCSYILELEEVPVSASALMQLKLGVARKLNLTESPADA